MNDTIEVPHFDGYKCIGYAQPKIGQYFLTSDNSKVEYVHINFVTPFLVYEKIQPKRYVFEETGEFRKVAYGETYFDALGSIQTWISTYKSACAYKILRRVEE